MSTPLDGDGAEIVDGTEYRDRYGDTWCAVFDATEFRLVQKADGSLSEDMYGHKEGGVPVQPWYEDVTSVVRSYGPMVPVEEDEPNPPYDLPDGVSSWSEWSGA